MSDWTSVDFGSLKSSERYFFMTTAIVPRPIAVVSTLNALGQDNLAPFSYFNAVSSDPPCLMFSIGQKRDQTTQALIEKDTLRNIRAIPEFVVHIAHASQMQIVDEASEELAFGESERAKLGLTLVSSKWIRVPRVAELPLALECTLEQLMELGTSTLVIGRIQGAHYRSDLREGLNHRINFSKLDPLTRLGRTYGQTHSLPRSEKAPNLG